MSKEKIRKILNELNPEFKNLYPFVEQTIDKLNSRGLKKSKTLYSEKDTFLITYADQFYSKDKSRLASLKDFLEKDLDNIFSIVHLLPFYPWTSDDGFSPIDYQKVDELSGSWEDVENIKAKKMFDCVFNHISPSNSFFQKALAGDKKAQGMFHIYDENTYKSESFQKEIPKIVRPRTTALFSPFKFNDELKYVWTTFSDDQVDTNLNNIDMMKYLLETFFFYIDRGAQYFRVDAVPFMWKEIGTNCSHLPKTHMFVQLLRAIVDTVEQDLYIVTESNVPHPENISYWGNGENEAHIIYNFSLAPLILHAMTFGSSKYINNWAKSVFDINPKTTFLNFTASHDGIGMRGLEGIVPDEEMFKLCKITEEKGGHVGMKRSRDGTQRPYELNIKWASFIKDETESEKMFIRKVTNSHCIVMFFPGIGAHYVHNLLGSFNWHEGFKESGIARRLNRKKLPYPLDLNEVSEKIKKRTVELIKYKCSNSAFSPTEKFEIHEESEKCLCFSRGVGENKTTVLFNLTPENITIRGVELKGYDLQFI